MVLVASILFLRPDLRGWTPENWTDPKAIVEPIGKGDAPFAIADCLPGTIDPNQTPRGPDYGYVATMRVLTCRSRSSAWPIVLPYLFLALIYPLYRLISRKRRA